MEINLDSAPQVQKILYGFLGLKMQFNNKTGQASVDKEALNRLKKLYPNEPILQDILDFKKLRKLLTTYTEIQAEADGRVRTSYGWVSTFRLNSQESHFGGGGNLQNIPVRTEEGLEVRKLFKPDPGLRLLASDLVQAEAMEVAWLSGDEELIDLFKSRVDVHWENAKLIFRLPRNMLYEAKEEIFYRPLGRTINLKFLRTIAKTVVHASNYGMGPMMLQTILILQGVWLEFGVCKQLLADASAARPLKAQWQKNTIEEVRLKRVLYNCFGDKREFRGRLSPGLFNSALAFRPQSTVGRILQFAIQDIDDTIPEYESLLNVHDEVVGQCEYSMIESLIPRIRVCLERPHEVNGRPLTVPCDFKEGPSWGELKEIKELPDA